MIIKLNSCININTYVNIYMCVNNCDFQYQLYTKKVKPLDPK